jgi:hypothetical protein
MYLIQHELARAHIDSRLAESRQRARAAKVRRSIATSRRAAADRAAQNPSRIW